MPPSYDDVKIAPGRSGILELRWTERVAGGRSKSRTRSCHTRDWRTAEDVKRALVAGPSARYRTERLHLYTLISEYLQHHESPAQKWALRAVQINLGHLAVPNLTHQAARSYVTARVRAGVSPSTVRRELGALKAVLNWSVKTNLWPPGLRLPHIELPSEGAPRTTHLTAQEADEMFRIAADCVTLLFNAEWRVGLFICIALCTGARASAIECLTWDRVDDGVGSSGRRSHVGIIDFRDASIAASKKRRVPVPIADKLRPVLSAARRRSKTLYVLDHPGSTRKAFTRFRDKHGFPAVTRHDLRRTWATLAVRRGVPIQQVAAILGDTVAVTEKHYAHHAPGYLSSAVNANPANPANPAI